MCTIYIYTVYVLYIIYSTYILNTLGKLKYDQPPFTTLNSEQGITVMSAVPERWHEKAKKGLIIPGVRTSAPVRWQLSAPPCPGGRPGRSQSPRASSASHVSPSARPSHSPSGRGSPPCLRGTQET